MKKFLFVILLLTYYTGYATHNRAGNIVYEHLYGYTYRVTIWTYTYTLSQADRPKLYIQWGDGTGDSIARVQKLTLPDYYYENKYVGIHTYPGPGVYEIVMVDPNRNEGVLNIPNSVNTPFGIKTTLVISPFIDGDNSPVLLNRPIDKAALHKIFIHNPGAYDPDGDSLSYKMDTCRYVNGDKIPGFRLPDATHRIYVDSITGDLIWDTPARVGIYNVAMRIEEWRHGVKIGYIIRDIQIEVEDSDNNPPQISTVDNVCVVVDSVIDFTVTATDPDNDYITLTAEGGPFQVDTLPAQFNQATGQGTVTSEFIWHTNCLHLRQTPYHVSFKAKDDNPEVQLADFKNVFIKLIGPPVKIIDIEPSNSNIFLKWTKAKCPNSSGYLIYRRNSQENFSIAQCQQGIPDTWGYTLIDTIYNPNDTTYIDKGLPNGFYYCYRIVPLYTDHHLKGVPSNKACVELVGGMPIFIKASVRTTDSINGSIIVKWIKPPKLDTIQHTGPFRYLLYYSRDLYGENYQGPKIFNGLNNTSYIDTPCNTKNNPTIYKLILQEFNSQTNSWQNIGDPTYASTPFLNIASSDRRNILTIDQNVPWQTLKYIIYRFNPQTNNYDSIAETLTNTYVDRNLHNLTKYCYKVKTVSRYTADSMPNPIINYSQINCGIPIDTIPPCCPKFTVQSDCQQQRNIIKWHMPADSCSEALKEYKLYYTNNINDEPWLLETFSPEDSIYYHYPENTLAACYIMTAVDSAGNEAVCKTQKQCIDVCNYYKLPNIFTPNGDGVNDVFHPYPYPHNFVEKVDMKIFNRWGNLVYQTDDPDINWTGIDINTGKPVPDGVYYYICDVYEYRLNGLQPRNISGFITVSRNENNKKP